jgi:hypothetical protein
MDKLAVNHVDSETLFTMPLFYLSASFSVVTSNTLELAHMRLNKLKVYKFAFTSYHPSHIYRIREKENTYDYTCMSTLSSSI